MSPAKRKTVIGSPVEQRTSSTFTCVPCSCISLVSSSDSILSCAGESPAAHSCRKEERSPTRPHPPAPGSGTCPFPGCPLLHASSCPCRVRKQRATADHCPYPALSLP